MAGVGGSVSACHCHSDFLDTDIECVSISRVNGVVKCPPSHTEQLSCMLNTVAFLLEGGVVYVPTGEGSSPMYFVSVRLSFPTVPTFLSSSLILTHQTSSTPSIMMSLRPGHPLATLRHQSPTLTSQALMPPMMKA